MTDVVAPEQQLTRRQLRALRESATAEPISGEGTPVLMKRDLAQTETLPILTRKKMLREQRRPARRATPTHAPRAAVLTALGVATIAAPLTGFVTPEQSAQAIGVQVATSAPLAQSLAAAAAVSQIEGAFPTATALAANPSAAAIALDLSARSQDSTVSACAAIEGASGVREANVQRTSAIYYPMAAGTYRSTSQYGARWGSFHSGTDMAASVGTPMYAVTDGTVVHAGDGIEGQPLHLFDHQAIGGHFPVLELWCLQNGLSYSRWCAEYTGLWLPEREVFTGSGDVATYPANENGATVATRAERARVIDLLHAPVEREFAVAGIARQCRHGAAQVDVAVR